MKAVVLVGGEGTRLRPLTETMPKPLVPLVDRPILSHVLDHLAAHDVDEVILSSSYLEPSFEAYLGERRGRSPALTWITEGTPLDTAGAIANAARDLDQTYFVLNGDIVTDLDLTAMLAFHRQHGAVATISLGAVDDARPFGLVAVDEARRVQQFREKPVELVPGLVNSGTYVLEPSGLRQVEPGQRVNIEREVFPRLIADDERVFGFVSSAYWIDTGTPPKYLRATFDLLEGRVRGVAYPAPFVDRTADVSLRAQLGRWVVIGPTATVGAGAQIEDAVVLAGAAVEEGARITESIVGPNAVVGAGAALTDAVLAEGSKVRPGVTSSGARLDPGAVLDA